MNNLKIQKKWQFGLYGILGLALMGVGPCNSNDQFYSSNGADDALSFLDGGIDGSESSDEGDPAGSRDPRNCQTAMKELDDDLLDQSNASEILEIFRRNQIDQSKYWSILNDPVALKELLDLVRFLDPDGFNYFANYVKNVNPNFDIAQIFVRCFSVRIQRIWGGTQATDRRGD